MYYIYDLLGISVNQADIDLFDGFEFLRKMFNSGKWDNKYSKYKDYVLSAK